VVFVIQLLRRRHAGFGLSRAFSTQHGMALETLARYFLFFSELPWYMNHIVTQRLLPIRVNFLAQIGEGTSPFMNAALLTYVSIVLSLVSGKVAFDLIKAGV